MKKVLLLLLIGLLVPQIAGGTYGAFGGIAAGLFNASHRHASPQQSVELFKLWFAEHRLWFTILLYSSYVFASTIGGILSFRVARGAPIGVISTLPMLIFSILFGGWLHHGVCAVTFLLVYYLQSLRERNMERSSGLSLEMEQERS